MKTTILLLLFGCHWLADYTHLSTSYMLNAKRLGRPILPIISHAGVHGILMGIVLGFFLPMNEPLYWNLLSLQVISHFLIDLWKGRMNGWFPSLQSPANKWHWVVFGLDQYFHAIVIILMVHFIG